MLAGAITLDQVVTPNTRDRSRSFPPTRTLTSYQSISTEPCDLLEYLQLQSIPRSFYSRCKREAAISHRDIGQERLPYSWCSILSIRRLSTKKTSSSTPSQEGWQGLTPAIFSAIRSHLRPSRSPLYVSRLQFPLVPSGGGLLTNLGLSSSRG